VTQKGRDGTAPFRAECQCAQPSVLQRLLSWSQCPAKRVSSHGSRKQSAHPPSRSEYPMNASARFSAWQARTSRRASTRTRTNCGDQARLAPAPCAMHGRHVQLRGCWLRRAEDATRNAFVFSQKFQRLGGGSAMPMPLSPSLLRGIAPAGWDSFEAPHEPYRMAHVVCSSCIACMSCNMDPSQTVPKEMTRSS